MWRERLTISYPGPNGGPSEGYQIERSYVALWRCGVGLDLGEPTRVLGIEPTISGMRTDSEPIGERLWARQFDMTGQFTLRQLIDSVIHAMPADPDRWRELGTRAKITLTCSLYPDDWNQGANLGPRQLRWLAEREIELCIDVHSWTPSLIPEE